MVWWLRYRIRRARRDDLPLLALIERAAASRFAAIGRTDALAVTTPPEIFEARQATGRLWVAAERGQRPVGFVFVTLIDGAVHVEELDVLPAHGRRGLGTLLTLRACRWAATSGAPRVTLSTYRSVPWNMPFYRRLGFEELPESSWTPGLARLHRAERGAGLNVADRLFMVKPLTKKTPLPKSRSCATL